MPTIIRSQPYQPQPACALPCPPTVITLRMPHQIRRCLVCGAPIVGAHIAVGTLCAHPSEDDCTREAQLLDQARQPARRGDPLMVRRARLILAQTGEAVN